MFNPFAGKDVGVNGLVGRCGEGWDVWVSDIH